jgi:hypothetical protein
MYHHKNIIEETKLAHTKIKQQQVCGLYSKVFWDIVVTMQSRISLCNVTGFIGLMFTDLPL